MRDFTVREKERLLDFLFRVLSDTKKTRVRQFLKLGLVSVNGLSTTRFDHPLEPGAKVSLRTAKEAQFPASPQFGVEVIFEDDSLIVIHKPSGLLTVATTKVATRTAFYATNDYLCTAETKQRYHRRPPEAGPIRGKKIFVVHRLDKDASGLLVFAKDLEVKLRLQTGWKKVTKRYYAMVEGVPKEPHGTVTSFLRENKTLKVYSTKNTENSKLSTTHYRVLRTSPHYSLLEVELKTGRKHQIRVHLSDLGHPITGDSLYGSKSNPAGRLALHAYYLAFKHPVNGREMIFQIPLPESFDRALALDHSSSSS